MVDHQFGCGIDVAAFQRVDDLVMFVVAAARNCRLAVKRDHQRGAGDEFVHEAAKNGVAAEIGERQVKIA
ncbi:hypothetical protein D9M72_631320 [compost metagenome]